MGSSIERECYHKGNFPGFYICKTVTDGTATGLVKAACKYVEDVGLKMENLRGQPYDGASIISGVHNGVQKLIKDRSSKPVPFVHCAAHNLNLVIDDAVNSVIDNDNFFGVIQSIYVFFYRLSIGEKIYSCSLLIRPCL